MRTSAPSGPPARAGMLEGPTGALLLVSWLAVALLALARLGLPMPGGVGGTLVLAVLGAGVAAVGLSYPPFAASLLLAAMFLRLALPPLVVTDPFVVAFAGVLASMALWILRNQGSNARPTFVEVAMLLYVMWCVASMILPHEYGPILYPLDGTEMEVSRFILISTVIPFTMFVLGRMAFPDDKAVRFIYWSALGFAAYSALVSVLQFHAPALVWPRYIVDSPNWEGRANGVLNQPSGTGITLIVGFVIALVLINDTAEPRWRRILLCTFPPVGSYAIFLTHTRAVYLGFGLVLILGMVLARGFRTGFVAVAVTAAGIVALNWGTFVSTDRAAGGIGSPNELHDRLNSMATGIWAFEQKPWFGWGIGRFVAVNSYHHQQWSQDIPWIRGLGISSHLNELGILAELGLVGLALWLCVLVTIVVLLVRTYRRLPAESAGGLRGRRLLFVALAALMAQFVAGLFADLRLFDFPTALVLLLVGVALRPPKDTADAAAPSPVHSSSGAVRLVPPARDRAVREEAL